MLYGHFSLVNIYRFHCSFS